jgi:peptide/nickel transport system permease protein
MRHLVLSRIPLLLLTLVLVASFTFLLSVVIPSDPASILVGPKGTPENVAEVREELGLDDPIIVQYGRYLADVFRLDLGYSYTNHQPVADVIRERLPWTILLAAAGLAVQLSIGIPLGLLLAARAGGAADRIALGWALVMVSIPAFVIGLTLLYVLAFEFEIFPLGGNDLPLALVLPALTLGLPGAAWYSRIMRTTSLEILHTDFARLLRAKGMAPRVILFKHTARAAIGPVLTMLAIDFGFFLGGAVIIERVFSWPGIGLTAYLSLRDGDTAMLMGCVLVGSFFVLVMNLIADLTRTVVDPRIRLA